MNGSWSICCDNIFLCHTDKLCRATFLDKSIYFSSLFTKIKETSSKPNDLENEKISSKIPNMRHSDSVCAFVWVRIVWIYCKWKMRQFIRHSRPRFAATNSEAREKCTKPCKMFSHFSPSKSIKSQKISEQSIMPKEACNFGYNNCSTFSYMLWHFWLDSRPRNNDFTYNALESIANSGCFMWVTAKFYEKHVNFW